VAQQIERLGRQYRYEDEVIPYLRPARNSRYTPDFIITTRSGKTIYVETKGRFLTEDRQKHLLIKKQYPDMDLRFVFSNSNNRISKRSKTTYAKWCEDKGFLYADKYIPQEWLEE